MLSEIPNGLTPPTYVVRVRVFVHRFAIFTVTIAINIVTRIISSIILCWAVISTAVVEFYLGYRKVKTRVDEEKLYTNCSNI